MATDAMFGLDAAPVLTMDSTEGGRPFVKELEPIEPGKYLRMDSDAPQRFADAFD